MFNLSSKTLTPAQLSILSKGLKFIPTSDSIDITIRIADIKEWERRMRLREYFYDAHNDDSDDEEAIPKKSDSHCTSPVGRDKWLDAYLDAVKEDIIKNVKRKVNKNITRTEEKAIKELLDDNGIVIKPADKGSGITIIDTKDYRDMIFQELSDSSTYKQTSEDLTKKITNKINRTVNDLFKRGIIDSELKHYMTPKFPKPGQIKENPKVHKKGNPLRIIISGIDHPTGKIAEFAEKQLDDYVTSLPSYIKDTTDFINRLKELKQPLPK